MGVKYPDNTPFDITITPDTNAYAANDVIGGLLTINPSARSGLITGITVSDDDNEGAAFKLLFFSSITTTIVDNAAFAPVLADLKEHMGEVATGTYITVNSLKYNYAPLTVGIPFYKRPFYAYMLTVATPTFSASKTINVRLHIEGVN